ncbi:MAG: alpha/beta hydrolase [Chthoniobacteraceae bacterium]
MNTRTVFLAAALFASTVCGAEPEVINIWPDAAPGEPAGGFTKTEEFLEPKPNEKQDVKRLTNISQPTLTIYRPEANNDTGAAVIIAPGGGYNILAWDLEGTEIAAWLNSVGVTGIVLKYRVPRREGTPQGQPPVQALMDAQRALSLVRGKAVEWKLDPKRIGMLGFSAGGHLTAAASTHYNERAYPAIDDIDKESCRPDFAVIIYPGGLLNAEKNGLREQIKVTDQTPPTFLAMTTDDPVNPDNAVEYWRALKNAKVPVELHLYPTGGHGYGMRRDLGVHATWNKRCEEWMAANGWLKRSPL